MTIERHLAMLTLTVGVNVVLTAIAAAVVWGCWVGLGEIAGQLAQLRWLAT